MVLCSSLGQELMPDDVFCHLVLFIIKIRLCATKKKKTQTRTNQPNKTNPRSLKFFGFPHQTQGFLPKSQPSSFISVKFMIRWKWSKGRWMDSACSGRMDEAFPCSHPSLLPVLARSGLGPTLLGLPWKDADPKK